MRRTVPFLILAAWLGAGAVLASHPVFVIPPERPDPSLADPSSDSACLSPRKAPPNG